MINHFFLASNKDSTEASFNERPNELNIQVTSPEGTVRSHKGTPAVNKEAVPTPTVEKGQTPELKTPEPKVELASSPDLEEKQFTNEAGKTLCIFYIKIW